MVTSNSNTKKSDAVSIVVLRKKLPEEPNDWTRPISHQNVRRRSRRRQKNREAYVARALSKI